MIHRALLFLAAWACCFGLPALAAPKGRVIPYVEASQVIGADFGGSQQSGSEVFLPDGPVAYSSLTVGAEGAATTRRTAIAVSLRFEQRVEQAGGEGNDNRIEGLVRGRLALVPGVVTLDAGGIATRIRDDLALRGSNGDASAVQHYALFAGPQFQIEHDNLRFQGHYRLGYGWADDEPLPSVRDGHYASLPTLHSQLDGKRAEISHSSAIRASLLPDRFPKGTELTVKGSWDRHEAEGRNARLKVTRSTAGLAAQLPVSHSVALAGEIGYETLRITVRDPTVLQGAAPADTVSFIATNYKSDGLAGVVGIVWRPSRRAELQAFAGRRFGSQTYYGSLHFAPTRRSKANIAIYDRVGTFGNGLVADVAAVSADFETTRDPYSGSLSPCLRQAGERGGQSCLTGALTPDRSLAFRERGGAISLNFDRNRTQLGLGAGYDQRSYYGQNLPRMPPVDRDSFPVPPPKALKDQGWWLSAQAVHAVDRQSSVAASVKLHHLQSSFQSEERSQRFEGSVAYTRSLRRGMQVRAAVGVEAQSWRSEGGGPENLARNSAVQLRGLIGFRYSL